jgi:hypothetical protein
MPFWIITIGFGSFCAFGPVKAFSLDTTTKGKGRPWPELP